MFRAHANSLLPLARRFLVTPFFTHASPLPPSILPLSAKTLSSPSFSSSSSSSSLWQGQARPLPRLSLLSLLPLPPSPLRIFSSRFIADSNEASGTAGPGRVGGYTEERWREGEKEDETALDDEAAGTPLERVVKFSPARSALMKEVEKRLDETEGMDIDPQWFPQLQQAASSSSSIDITKLLAQVEGLPTDPLGFEEIARFLESANVPAGEAEQFEAVKSALKKPIERKFREFVETMHGFHGDDQALTLFAATAVHAQLFGPTVKNDMDSVAKVLPFLKAMLFSDSPPDPSSSSPSPLSNKTDFEKALDETTEKERAILSSILDKVKPERTRIQSLKLSDLKYMKLYPKVVAQWVRDAKTPYGYYGEDGFWVPVELTPEAIGDIKQKQLEAAKRYGQLRADDDILDNAIPVYPDDLAGHYRFGLKPEEVEKMNFETKTIHALSFAHASQREINQFRIKRAIEKWGRFPGDTGSDEVQAAVLTEKMFYLAVHFKHNPNDKARKRMFLMLLARRQRLLRKLKIEKTDVYYALLRDLQIPDTARSYTTGFLPGLSIPKQANLSKQKRQRLLKGKVICQRAHDLAARRPKAKA